jgi:hypothetical protein
MPEVAGLWMSLELKSGNFMNDMKLAEARFDRTKEAAEKIGQTLGKLGLSFAAAGGAIVGGLSLAIVKTTTLADDIDEMSQRTGMSTKTLQEMRYVAGQTGTSLAALEVGFKRMAVVITDADEGVDLAVQSLAYLGLSVSDLKGLNPDEQFNKLANALARIEDPTLKASLAVDLFGRSGTAILPALADGASGFQKMRDEAEKLGLVMSEKEVKAFSEVKDNLDALKMSVGVFAVKISAALLPTIIEWMAKIKTIILNIKNWIDNHQMLFNSLIKIVGGVGLAVGVFGTLLTAISGILLALPTLTAAFSILAGPVGLVIAAIAALVAAGVLLYKNWDAIKYYGVLTWNLLKVTILSAIDGIISGLIALVGQVPIIGAKLKAAHASLGAQISAQNKKIIDNDVAYEAQKNNEKLANLQTHLAAKTMMKQIAAQTDAEFQAQMAETDAALREGYDEQEIDAYNAKLATFQDAFLKFINWNLGVQDSLSTGFQYMFTNIGKGANIFVEGIDKIYKGLRDGVIKYLSDMAAKWIAEHIVMAVATSHWKAKEISANAAVAASKAAAASAWSLWGALAIGAAIGVGVMAMANKFEGGGIVPGGSFAGDNIPAMVNSGEMILNKNQQATLFKMANTGGGGNGTTEQNIYIMLDGKTIAKATAQNLPSILRLYGAA